MRKHFKIFRALIFCLMIVGLLLGQNGAVQAIEQVSQTTSNRQKASEQSVTTAAAKAESITNQYQLKADNATVTVQDHFKLQLVATNNIEKTLNLQLPVGLSVDLARTQSGNPDFDITSSNSQTLKVVPKEIGDKTKAVELVLIAAQIGQYTIKGTDQAGVAIQGIDLKVIANPTPQVLALAPDTFDDGITNWVQKTRTEVGYKAFQGSSDRFLSYTFGGVDGGNDAQALSRISGYNIYGSQMNIFIKDSGRTVGAFFKGEISSDQAVRTSTGFGLVFDPNERNNGPKQSLLANQLTNKTYFVGHDSEGNLISKIMGKFERNGKTLAAELLLRPSLSGTTAVQQELYLKNETNQSIAYGTFIGQDTMLNGNDEVPMSAMANNSGLYITQNPYKLAINMKVPDGPSNYGVQTWTRSNPWFNGFSPQNFSGTGLEQKNLAEGYTVLQRTDTSYTAKWPFTTLAPGESQHYRQDIGITKAPDVAPEAYKEYQNETSTNGKNKPGDKIKFTLRAHNTGLDSSWGAVTFSDVIPNEFKIDPNTIRLVDQNGRETNVAPSAYNQTTRELKVAVPDAIQDNQWVSVTFETIALDSASGKVVRNNVNVTGVDNKVNQQERSASALVDVPFITVRPPQLTKQVKNITKNDSDFKSQTVAQADDQVTYQIKINNPASDVIESGAIFKDVFDSDLTPDKTATITYLDQNQTVTATQTGTFKDGQITLAHAIPVNGQGSAIITINATVKDTTKTEINNQASLVGSTGTGTSDTAKLVIQPSTGKIIVRYRDRQDENHKLAEDETLTGKIGTTKQVQPKVIAASQGNWTVVDSSNALNPDWSSTTAPDWELARDYDVTFAKDDQVITYRYEQSRIGIIADKRWDFGKYDTTSGDRNYYLKAKSTANATKKQPYSVGVEDYYTSKGWTLNVKQDAQFKADDPSVTNGSPYLDNSVLNFHNGHVEFEQGDEIGKNAPVSELVTAFELQPAGQPVAIMTHKNDQPVPGHYASHGFGIWQYQFGAGEQVDYSIGLRVPKATKRYPTQYTSQLTWSLVIAE